MVQSDRLEDEALRTMKKKLEPTHCAVCSDRLDTKYILFRERSNGWTMVAHPAFCPVWHIHERARKRYRKPRKTQGF